MTKLWSKAYLSKVIVPETITKKVAQLRAEKKTIATLNGSFDLLHAGHLEILYQAAQQADYLIVALNSDQSVAQYKKPSRPIITLEDRIKLLASVAFVSYITYFDELDPRAILEKIRPDVHVNGANYGVDCIEADVVRGHGGRLYLVDLLPGLSTTSIIQKIFEKELEPTK